MRVRHLRFSPRRLGRPVNATDSQSLARSYLYNRRNELAAATIGTNAYEYAYDTIGNRTAASANSVTNTYAANNLNQYTQIDASQLTYDNDGNLTQDDRFAYTYDAENRLVTVRPISPTEGALAVVNAYDHKHRRVGKSVERFDGEEWQTLETHAFVYDGGNIVLEKIALSDGTTRIVEYFWGNDLSGSEQGAGGVGGLLAVSIDGMFYFPCYDQNGNAVCYVSESGTIAAQYVFDPYGNVIDQYGNMPDQFAFGFSTKYLDRETGLIGYQRRFYRPDHGRWLNRDPIEEDGGENLYAFCQNNCVVYIDAKGESFDDVSNFMAGVADSLTFGLTGAVRGGINFAAYGDWEDPADDQSDSYTAGEYIEIAVEIVVSLGGTALRHVAKVVSREAVEKAARKSFRRAYGLTESGGFIHHINPIKGHPGGARARYPLPFEWAARGHWNMTWVATREEHMAAHETMKMFDKIDKWRTYTIGIRQGANMLMHKLNDSSDTKCWDSIDIQLNIMHTMGTINSVPNSVSISYEESGRSE